jgi:hypothetical protein
VCCKKVVKDEAGRHDGSDTDSFRGTESSINAHPRDGVDGDDGPLVDDYNAACIS